MVNSVNVPRRLKHLQKCWEAPFNVHVRSRMEDETKVKEPTGKGCGM